MAFGSMCSFKVRESSSLETSYQLSNLTTEQIALLVRQKTIHPEIEAAFRKIVEQENRVAALDEELARRETETRSKISPLTELYRRISPERK